MNTVSLYQIGSLEYWWLLPGAWKFEFPEGEAGFGDLFSTISLFLFFFPIVFGFILFIIPDTVKKRNRFWIYFLNSVVFYKMFVVLYKYAVEPQKHFF